MRIAPGVLVGWCVVVGCARGDGRASGGDDAGVDASAPPGSTLSIATPAVGLVLGEVADGLAVQAPFTATLVLADGTQQDVTADTRFQVDAGYGMFTGSTLTMTRAGKTRVFGTYADKGANLDITGRVQLVRIDPSLPSTIPGLFIEPGSVALAPQIVYTPADTVMPRNLGDFEVHWTDSHGNTAFEVSLHTTYSDVKLYVPGGNGLASQGPMASWRAFLASDWGAAVGFESSVILRVRGVNAAAPAGVGATPAMQLQLSNETMDGGLYYWATASASNAVGVFRHDMAKPGLPAEEYITTNQTSGRCVACHVLSRDGKKMSITYQDLIDDPGNGTFVDVETGKIATETTRWDYGTFTPDNAQFLGVRHGVLVVRDTATQAALATMPTTPPGTWATHPDLSPDGTQLVYVRTELFKDETTFNGGHIYVRSYTAAPPAFGPERPLVNDSANNFYPSWSPDGKWILFTRNVGGDSYDDFNSSTWVIKAAGGQPAIELAKADQALGLTNSWARWAPFAQTLGSSAESLYWVTMSSKRDFGVRLRNTGLQHRGLGGQRAQLWMTPFFPARGALGNDPSVPAFRLPFQNLDSSNHIAQWTERVVSVIQ